jgi:hypothetical protein
MEILSLIEAWRGLALKWAIFRKMKRVGSIGVPGK